MQIAGCLCRDALQGHSWRKAEEGPGKGEWTGRKWRFMERGAQRRRTFAHKKTALWKKRFVLRKGLSGVCFSSDPKIMGECRLFS